MNSGDVCEGRRTIPLCPNCRKSEGVCEHEGPGDALFECLHCDQLYTFNPIGRRVPVEAVRAGVGSTSGGEIHPGRRTIPLCPNCRDVNAVYPLGQDVFECAHCDQRYTFNLVGRRVADEVLDHFSIDDPPRTGPSVEPCPELGQSSVEPSP